MHRYGRRVRLYVLADYLNHLAFRGRVIWDMSDFNHAPEHAPPRTVAHSAYQSTTADSTLRKTIATCYANLSAVDWFKQILLRGRSLGGLEAFRRSKKPTLKTIHDALFAWLLFAATM